MTSTERPHLSSSTSDRGSRTDEVPRLERGGRHDNELGGRQVESTLHLKRDELRPEVRTYVDNLKAQVLRLLIEQGARNTQDFERFVAEKKVNVQDVQKLKDLLEKFAKAAKTGEAVEETERRREIAEVLIESAVYESDKIRDPERRIASELSTVKAALEAGILCPRLPKEVGKGIEFVKEHDRRALLYLQLADVHALAGLRDDKHGHAVCDDDLDEARYALTFIPHDTNSKFLALFKIAEAYLRLGRDPTQVIDQIELVGPAIDRSERPDDEARLAKLEAGMGKDPSPRLELAHGLADAADDVQNRFDFFLKIAEVEWSLGRDFTVSVERAVVAARGSPSSRQSDNWGELVLFLAKTGTLTDDILREGYASLATIDDDEERIKSAIMFDLVALRSGRDPKKIWEDAFGRGLGQYPEVLFGYAVFFAWELAGKADIKEYLVAIDSNKKIYSSKPEKLVYFVALEAAMSAYEGKDPLPAFDRVIEQIPEVSRESEDLIRHDVSLFQSVAAAALLGRQKPNLEDLPLLTGF